MSDVEDFTGTDGKPYHGGLRVIGGDGNYEHEMFAHEGRLADCAEPSCAAVTERWMVNR